jgi:hypothetical protein
MFTAKVAKRFRKGRKENPQGLLAFIAVFGDVHDFVLKDKQVGLIFTGQPNHVLVVVLDPAPDHFAIRQLDTHWLLFFSEKFQVGRFFRGLLGRRGPAFAGRAG